MFPFSSFSSCPFFSLPSLSFLHIRSLSLTCPVSVTQCLSITATEETKDATHDPNIATDGFSVSLWIKASYTMEEFLNVRQYQNYPREYIVSTGMTLAGSMCLKEMNELDGGNQCLFLYSFFVEWRTVHVALCIANN